MKGRIPEIIKLGIICKCCNRFLYEDVDYYKAVTSDRKDAKIIYVVTNYPGEPKICKKCESENEITIIAENIFNLQ